MLDKPSGIEEELRRWQAARQRKETTASVATHRDRRTVRINGREVEIVKKPRRAAS